MKKNPMVKEMLAILKKTATNGTVIIERGSAIGPSVTMSAFIVQDTSNKR